MPSIGEKFSALQATMLKNAKLVDRKEYRGGMDGLQWKPVHDVRENYDVDGDGKPDVSLFTREQDTGAWSYDGSTGRQHVAIRRLEVLDPQGRATSSFEELHAYRKNGRVVSGEMRGEKELVDLVGAIEHVDYTSAGRQFKIERAYAKDDGQGNAVVDFDTLKSDTKLYTP